MAGVGGGRDSSLYLDVVVNPLHGGEASFRLRRQAHGELEQTCQLTDGISFSIWTSPELRDQKVGRSCSGPPQLWGGSYLHSVGDGEAGVGRRDLPVHQNHHQGGGADQSHADEIQPHRQPAHGTAEQVKRGLVLVQQELVSAGIKKIVCCGLCRTCLGQLVLVLTFGGSPGPGRRPAAWSGPGCWR